MVFSSSSYHRLPDRFRPCRCLFHSVAVAPLVCHAWGTHRPLSTVILQLPCILSLSVGPLIQGLPVMRFDLNHECTRSLLHSFAYGGQRATSFGLTCKATCVRTQQFCCGARSTPGASSGLCHIVLREAMSTAQVSIITKHSTRKTLVSAGQADGCPWNQSNLGTGRGLR